MPGESSERGVVQLCCHCTFTLIKVQDVLLERSSSQKLLRYVGLGKRHTVCHMYVYTTACCKAATNQVPVNPSYAICKASKAWARTVPIIVGAVTWSALAPIITPCFVHPCLHQQAKANNHPSRPQWALIKKSDLVNCMHASITMVSSLVLAKTPIDDHHSQLKSR